MTGYTKMTGFKVPDPCNAESIRDITLECGMKHVMEKITDAARRGCTATVFHGAMLGRMVDALREAGFNLTLFNQDRQEGYVVISWVEKTSTNNE